jgi:hypothetical protein
MQELNVTPITENIDSAGNDEENVYCQRSDQEFRKLPSNVIRKAEEKWDVQDKDGPNP